MALILHKKESAFQKWYRKNKQRLSEKRKKLYAENPEYRQRALEASKRRRRGEPTLPKPPEAQIPFAEAAERIGIHTSTLHHYRRKKYFPEPKHHNGRRLWFSEKQVLLLKNLKDLFRVYRRKAWSVKLARLKEVKGSIFANWN
jgi:MerR HTH family regulatory protein